MRYNPLNLPDVVQTRDGDMVDYSYDALGRKEEVKRVAMITSGITLPVGKTLNDTTLSNVTTTTSYERYASNMKYSNMAMCDILLPGGYLKRTNTITTATRPWYSYCYYVTDHLGNVRAVIDGNGAIKQVNNYTPFGVEYGESAKNQTMATYQNNQFGGKEFDRKFELNLYDFSARAYDAAKGRWTTVDPLAEKRPWMSPYVYCSDNPLNRIDPDGRLDAPLYGTQVYKMHNLVSVDLDHKYRAQGGSLGNDPSITYSYAFRSVGINTKNSSQLAAEKNGALITVNSEFFKIRNVGSSPHVGTDYLAKYGSNVYSYGDGSIVSTGENSAGKFVTVKYGNGDVVNFMHLSETGSFKVGENIYEGQILGQSGTYGGGPHLHVSAVNSSGELIDVTSRNYGTVSNSEFFTTYGGDYLNLKAAKEANQNISPMLTPPNNTQQQDNTKLKNNSMGGW